MSKMTFSLNGDQAPDPPRNGAWVDVLRWMICVMNPDDRSFPFIAGVFARCLKNDGVTERQVNAANRVLKRVYEDWSGGVLECQCTPPPEIREAFDAEMSLADMEPEGEA